MNYSPGTHNMWMYNSPLNNKIRCHWLQIASYLLEINQFVMLRIGTTKTNVYLKQTTQMLDFSSARLCIFYSFRDTDNSNPDDSSNNNDNNGDQKRIQLNLIFTMSTNNRLLYILCPEIQRWKSTSFPLIVFDLVIGAHCLFRRPNGWCTAFFFFFSIFNTFPFWYIVEIEQIDFLHGAKRPLKRSLNKIYFFATACICVWFWFVWNWTP